MSLIGGLPRETRNELWLVSEMREMCGAVVYSLSFLFSQHEMTQTSIAKLEEDLKLTHSKKGCHRIGPRTMRALH